MTKILLVVEDDPIVARLYQKSLAFDGFHVETAIGGREGLEKIRAINPDLVLLDVMMPEPNGMEVLDIIKKDPNFKHIPVVMLTNLSGKGDAEIAMERGAEDYWIKKDADPNELGKKIKVILDRVNQENN